MRFKLLRMGDVRGIEYLKLTKEKKETGNTWDSEGGLYLARMKDGRSGTDRWICVRIYIQDPAYEGWI